MEEVITNKISYEDLIDIVFNGHTVYNFKNFEGAIVFELKTKYGEEAMLAKAIEKHAEMEVVWSSAKSGLFKIHIPAVGLWKMDNELKTTYRYEYNRLLEHKSIDTFLSETNYSLVNRNSFRFKNKEVIDSVKATASSTIRLTLIGSVAVYILIYLMMFVNYGTTIEEYLIKMPLSYLGGWSLVSLFFLSFFFWSMYKPIE